ncbi:MULTISPECIES: RidA family protein [Arthrospira]|uniref:YjgF-like protein n=1 Tax=Limnospira platensis NIES-46 TaxID=1236695 RepID=A0A5M3TCP1_LIMPL|nr:MULTISPECIES: RidA family protein [Arthrospira]AMW30993.1 reactive intermediate/imine deaminase [Arthrospira platensis YZ]KDR54762.1 endoribonuclease L-PSP [Arthrospira platensis str. Paraca]MBD2669593.1 RidA family protein [Arthrospira platensis FACHB-439]MBD2711093.1 RidA family protein [Arthrospira platensis FACHB-835]MDF2208365.1 RidA family protein [Arthrospira platensis NCB002]MDT9182779.1 RidA family protein [Limnospira sp. PMC 289.06]MDT9294923.1 RidA family protein [Arthrospira p
MKRQIICTNHAPAPVGPYSQAVIVNGMVFVSGQIAIDPETNQLMGSGDIEQQTKQVMANLEAILTAAKSSWSEVVKTTIFLKDMSHFSSVNEIYAKFFDSENAPARACVEVARLPKDVLVEIDCIATVSDS